MVVFLVKASATGVKVTTSIVRVTARRGKAPATATDESRLTLCPHGSQHALMQIQLATQGSSEFHSAVLVC